MLLHMYNRNNFNCIIHQVALAWRQPIEFSIYKSSCHPPVSLYHKGYKLFILSHFVSSNLIVMFRRCLCIVKGSWWVLVAETEHAGKRFL